MGRDDLNLLVGMIEPVQGLNVRCDVPVSR